MQEPKVLISEDQLQERVKELGAQLNKDYAGKEITAICILKGGVVFFSDMIRQVQVPLKCEFLGVASYHGGKTSSGEVKLTQDVKDPIENKHVIVFEDIVDTGLTLSYLLKLFKSRNPASLKVCSLLFKPSQLKTDVSPDYVGFEIENRFVVGYGLDLDGLYRGLPYIGAMD